MARQLLTQHAAVTRELRDSIDSRRGAVELRECLTDLIALENAQVETVAVLHDRIQQLLARVQETANSPVEQTLVEQLRAGFESYSRQWANLPIYSDPDHEMARRAATRLLETEVLRKCQELEEFHSQVIEDSTAMHERQFDWLTWGMALIGGLGGLAGAILGYGVARTLNKSIHQLRVQLRDVAGKLDPSISEIVVTANGDFREIHAEIEQLGQRIESTLSALQQRESEVIRAEQLAAVGQLAAGVGHELRNPLTSVKLLVQAGLHDGQLEQDDLHVIDAEIRRMERSLQSFLDFARPPQTERRPTDIVLLINEVKQLLHGRADKQQVTVEFLPPSTPVIISVDRDQIRQVLVNLWLNALDAMPHGGTLRLQLEALADGGVGLTVTDTGPGIAPKMLPRLFQPFTSTKDTGLGLGLVICRRIIEAHRGMITATNAPGGGACFHVILPGEPSHD